MTFGIVSISLNQAHYLAEAMDSVRLSDPHRLRYVIVDAGSTDGSRDIIERKLAESTFKIFEPDRGPADGLNKGFAALADTDICGYINADDRFAPGALDYVAKYFSAHPQADILLGSIRIINERGRSGLRGRFVDKADLTHFANRNCYFWQQATFFRRSAFLRTNGFNLDNHITWDSELVVDMILAGATVAHTSQVLGEFRIHGASITGSGRLAHDAAIQHQRVGVKIARAGMMRKSFFSSSSRLKLGQFTYRLNVSRQLRNLVIGFSDLLRPSSNTE